MTLQQYDDLHDDAHRLVPEVVEAMADKAAEADYHTTPWVVEYEIPATSGGWVYMGNPGALSTTHQWADRFPEYSEAVVIHHTPTHPQDKTPDVIEAYYVSNPSSEVGDQDRQEIHKAEGEPYRTPLYVRRRMFWEAVEAAIEWMENNPIDDDSSEEN